MAWFHYVGAKHLRRINGKGGFAACSAYLSQAGGADEENLPRSFAFTSFIYLVRFTLPVIKY